MARLVNSVSGKRVPEEIRKARRQRQIADPVGLTRFHRSRNLLKPEDKFWAGQNRLSGHADSTGLEVAVFAAAVVEGHQTLKILGCCRSTESPGGKILDDLRRTWQFFGRAQWAARENVAAAVKIRHAGDIEGTGNLQLPKMRIHRHQPGIACVDAGQGVFNRTYQIVQKARMLVDKSCGNMVGTGLHEDPAGHQVQSFGLRFAHSGADIQQRDPRAIDRYFKLLARNIRA